MLVFVAIVPVGAAYDGNAAARYADNHTTSSYTFADDCTNFASNALQAGGWKQVGQYAAWNTDAWYYEYVTWPSSLCFGYSRTWTVANELYKFCSRRQERALAISAKGPYSKYKVGDLIQIDYNRDGSWDHTMVVTAIKPDYSDLRITQHGDNAPIKMLSSIKNTYPGANFIGWSIR